MYTYPPNTPYERNITSEFQNEVTSITTISLSKQPSSLIEALTLLRKDVIAVATLGSVRGTFVVFVRRDTKPSSFIQRETHDCATSIANIDLIFAWICSPETGSLLPKRFIIHPPTTSFST